MIKTTKMKIYNCFCKGNCKLITPHVISKQSRARGVALTCCVCGSETGYKNFNKLKEFSFEEAQKELDAQENNKEVKK